ncbi:hypothetical protein C8Q76DRAFT_810970 [Earliella scabrosa]|nr:hypothetical protein C8Q76DRAFT_810970 [Earliella scabrosa]
MAAFLAPPLTFLALESLTVFIPPFGMQSCILPLERQCAPHLRRVFLNGMQFPWMSSCYRSLRAFEVLNLPDPITLDRLLRLLRDCPELDRLRLGISAVRSSEGLSDSSDIQPVSLPKLRNLEIYEVLPIVAAICSNITAAADCSIWVYSNPWNLRPPGHAHAISALVPTYTVFQNILPSAHTFTLTLDTPKGPGIKKVWIGAVIGNDRHIDVQARTGGYERNEQPPRLTVEVWHALLDAFAAAPLRHAVISCTNLEDVDLTMWTALYSRFPGLESIRVDHCAFVETQQGPLFWNFLLSLGPDSARRGPEPDDTSRTPNAGKPRFLVPRLRSFELRYLYLTNSIIDRIIAVLQARQQAGVPIAELVLSECYCVYGLDVGLAKARLADHATVSIR